MPPRLSHRFTAIVLLMTILCIFDGTLSTVNGENVTTGTSNKGEEERQPSPWTFYGRQENESTRTVRAAGKSRVRRSTSTITIYEGYHRRKCNNFLNILFLGVIGALIPTQCEYHDLSIRSTECWNMNNMNDKISSLEVHGNCFTVWEHKDCTGATMTVSPTSGCEWDLGKCYFRGISWDDQISSISTCAYSPPTLPPPTTSRRPPYTHSTTIRVTPPPTTSRPPFTHSTTIRVTPPPTTSRPPFTHSTTIRVTPPPTTSRPPPSLTTTRSTPPPTTRGTFLGSGGQEIIAGGAALGGVGALGGAGKSIIAGGTALIGGGALGGAGALDGAGPKIIPGGGLSDSGPHASPSPPPQRPSTESTRRPKKECPIVSRPKRSLSSFAHVSFNRTKRSTFSLYSDAYWQNAPFNQLIRSDFDRHEVDEWPSNSIYRYYSTIRRSGNGGFTTVPHIVLARVHAWHVQDHVRSEFTGTNFDEIMRLMHAQGYINDLRPKDEKGHIVASQLGGQARWYNLAPQTPALNANRGVPPSVRLLRLGWRHAEIFGANWLKDVDSECGWIDWKVAIRYDMNESDPRPIGFRLEAKFYRGDGISNLRFNRYFDNNLYN